MTPCCILQVQSEGLSPHDCASFIHGWLAQECLSLFGPETADGFKLSMGSMEERIPYPERSRDHVSIRDGQMLGQESCLLAQLQTDVLVQPPVTELHRQVQETHIQGVLLRSSSKPQVCILYA